MMISCWFKAYRDLKKCYSHKRILRMMLMMCALFMESATVQANVRHTEMVPRTIIAFYDSRLDGEASTTEVHKSAEMPLNHLGLKVLYQDIHEPLPDNKTMVNIRGILLWTYWDTMPDANLFLEWLVKQMQAGKRVVIMGSHAFENVRGQEGIDADPLLVEQFWHELGLSITSEWVASPFDVQLKPASEKLTEFERPLGGLIPAFPRKKITSRGMKSYLQAYRSSSDEMMADLIAIGPRGGYVAPGYSLIYSAENKYRYWYLDPFGFFRVAFATDEVPKPDTTTLSGRRIYYSHVDGDGWRSLSQVPGYRGKNKSVTEVLLHEILMKYPDLPVTVAPVAADLDENWFGNKDSQRLAREIFALPHVEAGSHTMSHPLEWQFFENYSAEKELPFLDRYPLLAGENSFRAKLYKLTGYGSNKTTALADSSMALKHQQKLTLEHASKPRAYYNGPFDLHVEIQRSVDIIQRYLPYGKKVELLQWSGDCRPYSAAIRQSRVAGLRNINGGDTRLDREFDSFAWVAPIGRDAAGERQIYASASNENTYTYMWQRRYFGYRYLEKTLQRTETPWRIKPINIYYHNYSAERLSSLNALRKDLSYAQKQRIAPVTTSQYAGIADGFYTTEIEKTGRQQWKIKNRGQLQTIRFDQATFKAVDFNLSQGVVGQNHLHGSLYVHLDSANAAPVVTLKEIVASDRESSEGRPYLIDARWQVKKLETSSVEFDFSVQGYGRGNMNWYVPVSGRYQVLINYKDGQARRLSIVVGEDHRLNISLDKAPIKAVQIHVALSNK